MLWRISLRSALIALVIGWGVVFAFAGVFILLQRSAILTAFPTATPDKTEVEIQSRLNSELAASPLLLFVQIGVASGVLVWQVGRTVRRLTDPLRARQFGLIAGGIVALVETVMAVILHTPWIFTIPMIAMLTGASIYAAWSGLEPQDTKAAG